MRLAQQVAITTGKQTRIEFRWEAADYRIFLPVEKTTVKLPEGIVYVMNNFPLEKGIRKLSFSNIGAPNQGGTVGFKNRRGSRLYVIITPATGRVKVSSEPPAEKY